MAITVPPRKSKRQDRAVGHPVPVSEAVEAQSSFDRDYWIGHCQGYRVDGAEGRIGFVEDLIPDRGDTVLAIRAGWLGRRTLLVATSEVAVIVPQAERIWLRAPTTIIASEAFPGGDRLA